MTINEKILRLKAINLNKLLDDSLRAKEKDILDLNRDQMFEDGIMNVKTEKTERYSPATIRAKKKAPFSRTKHITLKWTGDFHKRLELLIFAKKIVISSKNIVWGKWLETQERFENALGLTENSIKKTRDIIKPELLKRLRNVI